MKLARTKLNDLPLARKQLIFQRYNDTVGVTDANIEQFLDDNFINIFK